MVCGKSVIKKYQLKNRVNGHWLQPVEQEQKIAIQISSMASYLILR